MPATINEGDSNSTIQSPIFKLLGSYLSIYVQLNKRCRLSGTKRAIFYVLVLFHSVILCLYLYILCICSFVPQSAYMCQWFIPG